MTMTRTTTEENFGKDIIESGLLSIVEFKAEWSGSCQIVAPIFENLATSYKGLADFYIVDIEEEKTIANAYAIMDLPTILFFKNGEVIDYVTGLTSKNMLKEKISKGLLIQLRHTLFMYK